MKRTKKKSTDLDVRPTGIDGLDLILGGGIPSGWFVSVSGGAGIGKTTIGIQFLLEGILKYEEPGLLVTFNEPFRALNAIMNNYGWDLDALQQMEKLTVLDLSSAQMMFVQRAARMQEFSLDFITDKIIQEVRRIGARRLVIDPLNAFSLLFQDEFEIRKELHRVIGILWSEGCTTFSLYEMTTDDAYDPRFPVFATEDFLAYGVIRLQYLLVKSKRERGIEILKMRGMKHSRQIHPVEITKDGLQIDTNNPIQLD